ncbi:MAG TPA: thiamine pyrophosphate-dependent dehydrogenase E1 component subunit alpha [Anaerolineae bacterium]|nr:thiamine pyrophosphate-dependent dehydrogenase E1 component subunit alpha [Anaerolineae bacterium]
MEVSKETLIALYRSMVRIRTFEDRVAEIYWEGKTPAFDIGAGTIPGEMHLFQGQEAVAVGVCAHLRQNDFVASTHRGHGHLIAKGVDLKPMLAEIMGRKTGLGQGKGGHMHLFSADLHYGCGGIIGGGLPHATGAALAFKKQGRDNVAVAFLGEGAANIGAFHESLNLAALWKLPAVFVVEDNLYAVSVPKTISTSVKSNAERGAAYGIPGVLVDGMDVMAVYEASGEAVARARRGEGPSIIEALCYRYRGHFEGDAEPYRTPEEVAEWRKKDPIPKFHQQLLAQGVLAEAQANEIDAEIAAEVKAAEDFARTSPFPAPEEALEHVFA